MSKLQYETESTKDFSDQGLAHNSKRSFFIELTISFVYTLLKIILVGVVIAFAASLSFSQLRDSNAYERIQQNLWLWQQQIIMDFTVVEAANCPQGWQQYSHYQWAGNMEGCSCTFRLGLFDYDAVLQGRCKERQFAKGCLTVPAHSAIPFRFWKKQAHLCVKRLHNYNFYSSEENIINPLGYNLTKCAANTNFQINLIDPIPCPITTIVKDLSLNKNIPQLNFTFSRGDNYPLVQFRISEYKFCQGLYDNGKSPGRTSNYILENYYQYECSSNDSRTILLDSQGEADFFGNNPKIEYITSTLPAYPQLTNEYVYHLGFVRYPAWSYKCRISNQYNLITATSYLNLSQIQSTMNLFQVLVVVNTFLSLLFVIYYWISIYFYLKTKYMHGYLYLKDYEIRKINPHTNIVKDRTYEVVKYLAFEISPAANIIFLVVLYYQLSSAKYWFASAYSCTEGSFVYYLKDYEKFLGSKMVIALSAVFVSLGLICLDICYLLWRYFKGDLQDVEQQLEEQIVSVSNVTSQQIQIVSGDMKEIKTTEQFLVDNSFPLQQRRKKPKDLNIYTFEQDDGKISEYSQQSKWD